MDYAADLRGGRVNPMHVSTDWSETAGSVDTVKVANDAALSSDFPAYLKTLPPATPAYAALRSLLKTTRAAGSWPQIPSTGEAVRGHLRPGRRHFAA